MTAVGKILVFFNLLFSLGVGTVAILNYMARTHWAAGYEDVRNKLEIAQASRNTYQSQNDRLIKDRDQLNGKLTELAGKMVEVKNPDEAAQRVAETLRDARDQVRQQKEEIERLNGALTAERKKSTAVETVATVSLEDVKRRQADVEKMRETLKAETDRNVELVKEKNNLRDRAVAAEIQSTSLRDINTRIEAQLQEMARDLVRLKAQGGRSVAGRGATNPPPDNVEGLVKRFDSNSNLVTITLGSDAGLAQGNTMEVFRLGAIPKYLGQIKIIRVEATQAVGQPTGKLNGAIQPGDRVASRIMGGN